MRLPVFVVVPVFLTLAAPLHAALFDVHGTSYEVEHVTGTGSNTALLEIDFGTNLLPDTHTFAYQWDGTAQNLGGLMSALQSDAFGFSYNAFPGFLDTIFYETQQPADIYPTSFWYWFTANTANPAWIYGQTAFETQAIADGGFYGWALQHDDPNIDVPFNAPPEAFAPPSHFPAQLTAVPEPATVMVLAVGALAMIRRRR